MSIKYFYTKGGCISIKIHDFNESIQKGKQGEDYIISVLKKNKHIKSITDVSNDSSYFEKDIDYLIEFNSGKIQSVELKTDFTTYPNFFYEEISSMETNSLGCFEKTEADRLLYYFIKLNILYIFDMEKFRNWFHENKEDFIKKGYKKQIKNYRYNGSTYTTVGYAFPRDLLENKPWVRKIVKNK